MEKKKCFIKGHLDQLYDRSVRKVEIPVLVEESVISVIEEEVIDGRVMKVMKNKKVNPNDNVKNFKVSDFCLENLQASGAIANLKNVKLDGSVIGSIDSAVAGLQSLENINISE